MKTKEEIEEAIKQNVADLMMLPTHLTSMDQVIKKSVLHGQLQALEWVNE